MTDYGGQYYMNVDVGSGFFEISNKLLYPPPCRDVSANQFQRDFQFAGTRDANKKNTLFGSNGKDRLRVSHALNQICGGVCADFQNGGSFYQLLPSPGEFLQNTLQNCVFYVSPKFQLKKAFPNMTLDYSFKSELVIWINGKKLPANIINQDRATFQYSFQSGREYRISIMASSWLNANQAYAWCRQGLTSGNALFSESIQYCS